MEKVNKDIAVNIFGGERHVSSFVHFSDEVLHLKRIFDVSIEKNMNVDKNIICVGFMFQKMVDIYLSIGFLTLLPLSCKIFSSS
mmetsp:Transcript_14471/g.31810  ORF Transcript_14471/g.31810 Transcript_14471/m.31810 type:complete len:84 (+) Transcript_14471:2576-2827(+)